MNEKNDLNSYEILVKIKEDWDEVRKFRHLQGSQYTYQTTSNTILSRNFSKDRDIHNFSPD